MLCYPFVISYKILQRFPSYLGKKHYLCNVNDKQLNKRVWQPSSIVSVTPICVKNILHYFFFWKFFKDFPGIWDKCSTFATSSYQVEGCLKCWKKVWNFFKDFKLERKKSITFATSSYQEVVLSHTEKKDCNFFKDFSLEWKKSIIFAVLKVQHNPIV